MSFIKKIKQNILSNSDTFNHYKNENSILKKDLNVKNKNLKDLNIKFNNLNKDIKDLQKKQRVTDETLDSNYYLFSLLMLDYDLKSKGILKNIHDLCQELLNFVVLICEKNDLNYWLVGGNLIGAVRHGGYIPWDDDMDVGLMRKEFYKFNNLVKNEIENSDLGSFMNLYVNSGPRKDFINPFTKIDCVSQDNHVLAGVDIFPYDYAKDDNINLEEFCNFRNEYFIKLCEDDEETLIEEYFNKFNLDWDDGKYIIPNPTFLRFADRYRYDLVFWEKEKVFPLSSINFNGKEYRCPNDVDYFLKEEYGDIYSIPKILKDQHHNVDKIRNVSGINNQYEEILRKLKNFNEGY